MEVEKLKIGHYRSISIYFMAILGGQITLLGSLFSDYPQRGFAIAAIFFMLLASLAAFSISDVAVKRVSPTLNFKNRFWKWLYGLGSTTNEVEYVKSVVSAILFACSIGFYLWFVLGGL
ncbi:hypothetical protein [Azoarcus taiwanensis]|uniref:Uncharacterized protein n=1 Tax=Azoarcus taiwanensis TaxID=666964 RepID=A0A972JBD4_9RHOO|nr:hypothetical protein [Azoarcus taiwanensis]NMG04930.1 hypothetical protein [Azoarcus taiwanensis]